MSASCTMTVHGCVWLMYLGKTVADTPFRLDLFDFFKVPRGRRLKSCRSWLARRRGGELVACLRSGGSRLRSHSG